MNKNLEKEYKALMTEDVPDLWERIEAGLEPKQQSAKKVSLWRKYRAWGGAVAACLCLAVAIPVILGGSKGGNMSASDGAASENCGIQDNDMAGAKLQEDMIFDEQAEAADNSMANIYTIRAKVTAVSEAEGRTIYIVQIEEAGNTGFVEGNYIDLYDEGVLSKELTEGESYLFDFSISIIGNGITEYIINNIRYE